MISLGHAGFDEGNIVDLIRSGKVPQTKFAIDQNGLANGVIKYSLHLDPGELSNSLQRFRFTEEDQLMKDQVLKLFLKNLMKQLEFWRHEDSHIRFNLPPPANRIISTYRSNLAYILVNRDKAGIQPGSRSYERSWIRDGALTSSAL